MKLHSFLTIIFILVSSSVLLSQRLDFYTGAGATYAQTDTSRFDQGLYATVGAKIVLSEDDESSYGTHVMGEVGYSSFYTPTHGTIRTLRTGASLGFNDNKYIYGGFRVFYFHVPDRIVPDYMSFGINLHCLAYSHKRLSFYMNSDVGVMTTGKMLLLLGVNMNYNLKKR